MSERDASDSQGQYSSESPGDPPSETSLPSHGLTKVQTGAGWIGIARVSTRPGAVENVVPARSR